MSGYLTALLAAYAFVALAAAWQIWRNWRARKRGCAPFTLSLSFGPERGPYHAKHFRYHED